MIKVSSRGDIYALHISGNIDHSEMVDVRNTISNLIREGHSKVIVSMEEVERVNYLSIGVLVERLRRLRNCGGDLKLVGMSGYLRTFFAGVGAEKIFDSFDSMEEALKSFSSPGTGERQFH